MLSVALVTDRAQSDVLAKNDKGTYQAADLNRVEKATGEVANELTVLGYPVTITIRTNWTYKDIPDIGEMTRYLGNVRKCVTQFHAVPGVALPSSMDGLNYVGANNIEKVLVGLDEMAAALPQYYRRCGAAWCGGA